ncbi:MAG: alpha/beta hydrolase-fold protein [Planctomycetota bacterium]
MRPLATLFFACLMSLPLFAQDIVKIPLGKDEALEVFVLEPYRGRGLQTIDLPLFLALPPGGQDLKMARYAVDGLGKAAAARGYLAVVPVARDKIFFKGGEKDLPALFTWLEKKYRIDASRSLVAGISNGGRSAFHIAGMWPKRFAGIGAAPGVIVKGSVTKPLEGKPAWMRVGEKDNDRWTKGGEKTAATLKEMGNAVSYEVVKGMGHNVAFDADEMLNWLESRVGKFERVKIKAPDDLEITGELYATGDKKKSIILFCHQAGSSRGEYRTIAKKLLGLGYNGLAIDQRSGRGGASFSHGVSNETAKRHGKKVTYLDAKPDIEAALDWLTKKGYTGPRVLWGSSYSSALALVLGPERDDVDVVCAFAPGEYLAPDRGMVGRSAGKLSKPTLIVSPEGERARAEPLFKALTGKHKHFEISEEILHGSRTLFLGESRDALWKVVEGFLAKATAAVKK